MARLWDKGQGLDQLIHHFTVGEDYLLDQRLVPFDVQASKAHAEMLAEKGLLTQDESAQLCASLDELQQEHAEGKWSISIDEEDCHTALEARLTERLGDLGGKIHLGRSRNDQVLVALRLFMRAATLEISEALSGVEAALGELENRHKGVPLPGYTHLQRGMPSSVAQWAGAFRTELGQDGLQLATNPHLELNPLGSAAGYGTPGLDLDRESTTRKLGFRATQEPAAAAQLSRGKAEATLAFACSLVLQDVGRLASDLVLYASQEFAFVKLAPAITTGSSIMPQKRNPDVYELLRAHSSQATADLVAILGLTAKMPSGYHRDLQLLKAPLFRIVDRTILCLQVTVRALELTNFDAEKTTAAMDPSLHAAERAFRLVQDQGISFREAYRRVAADLSQN